MPINWEDVKSFGAGTINDMFFDLPELIAKATGKNVFEEMRKRNPTAYEAGKTASIVGGLIPGGVILRGLKGLKTADTALDLAKGIKRFDTAADVARGVDTALDVAKTAKKADAAGDFIKGLKGFDKVDDSQRIVSPRVRKLLENIDRGSDIAKKVDNIEDTEQYAKNLFKRGEAGPFYIHGAEGNPNLKNGPIQYGTKPGMSVLYGKNGSVWYSMPKKEAKVINLNNPEILKKIKEGLRKDIAYNDLVDKDVISTLKTLGEEEGLESLAKGFNPIEIYENAENFDNKTLTEWLEYFLDYPDAVYTKNGMIVFNKDKMHNIKVADYTNQAVSHG